MEDSCDAVEADSLIAAIATDTSARATVGMEVALVDTTVVLTEGSAECAVDDAASAAEAASDTVTLEAVDVRDAVIVEDVAVVLVVVAAMVVA
jgi:hypothetical protein